MTMNTLPKKTADQFVPKPTPEYEDLFVFWDRITKKMARASIEEFLTWLKNTEQFALAEHGHQIEDVELLAETLLSQSADLEQVKTEILQLLEIMKRPPANPAGVNWVVEPTVTPNGDMLDVGAAEATWYENPVIYHPQSLPLGVAPVQPNIRVDAVYANELGEYQLHEGQEGLTAARPAKPHNMIWVRDVIWTSEGIKTDEPNANLVLYIDGVLQTQSGETIVIDSIDEGTIY